MILVLTIEIDNHITVCAKEVNEYGFCGRSREGINASHNDGNYSNTSS